MSVIAMPRAKLRTPEPAPATIDRPRLDLELSRAIERPVTLIVAGPGYGKTSLVADVVRARRHAWYALDPSDRALGVLASGVATALGMALGSTAADLLPAADDWDDPERPDLLAGLLVDRLNDVESSDPVLLVLDDAHHLAGEGARFVEALARQATSGLRLILISRTEPALALARIRAKGAVSSLDAAMLAFTAAELASVLELAIGSPPDPDLVDRIAKLTVGWPALVRLVADAHRSGHGEAALDAAAGRRGAIFDYLAEEVFGDLGPDARQMLRLGATLDRFDAPLLEALGVRAAEDLLDDFGHRGLYLVPVDTGAGQQAFALHALVREFASRRWPMSAAETAAVRADAAGWLEASGRGAEALALFATGDKFLLGEAIARLGPTMIGAGQASLVLDAARELPPDQRGSRVADVLADALVTTGRAGDALASLEIAAGATGPVRAATAWRLARLYLQRNDYGAVMAVCERAAETSEPLDRGMLIALSAWAGLRIGRYEEARAGLDVAAAIAATDRLDALAAVVARARVSLAAYDRRMDVADEQVEIGRAAAERAGDLDLVLRFRAMAASSLADLRFLDEATPELDAIVVEAAAAGSPLLLSEVLNSRAEVWFGSGRLEEAGRDHLAAVALRRRAGAPATMNLAGVGDCLVERGDSIGARRVLEEATASARTTGDRSHLVACLAELARARIADDLNEAASIAAEALALGQTTGYPRALALASAAWIAWLRGDPAASRLRVEAEREAAAQRTPLIPEEMQLLAAALEPDPAVATTIARAATAGWEAVGNAIWTARARLVAAAIGRDPAQRSAVAAAEETLRALGDPDTGAGLAGSIWITRWREARGVRIEVMGGFRVILDGVVLGPTDWQSRKARDLLKLLVLERGQPISKDALGETLWPEDDPAAVAKRLSVALATVRGGLDPGRRFAADHVVGSDGQSLWLDLDHVVTDLERFHLLADAATNDPDPLTAPGRLRAAEAAYRGDLLPEDPYADWASEPRERLRSRVLDLCRRLADLAAVGGDAAESVRYRLRLLERDPFDEAAHLSLIRTLLGAGRHGEARRAYASYVGRLREIDVEPAPFPSP